MQVQTAEGSSMIFLIERPCIRGIQNSRKRFLGNIALGETNALNKSFPVVRVHEVIPSSLPLFNADVTVF